MAPGDTVTLSGTGFLGGEKVVITLPTGGTVTVTADANGAFVTSWKVPADWAAGTARFTALGQESGRTAEASVTVQVSGGVPGKGTPGVPGAKSGGGLAVTGAEVGPLVLLTILSLAAGAGALVVGRRRSRDVRAAE